MNRTHFFLMIMSFCFTNIKGMDEKASAEELAQAPAVMNELQSSFPTLPDGLAGTLATVRCLQSAVRRHTTAFLLSSPDLTDVEMENLRRKINPVDFAKILKKNRVLKKRFFISENAEALIPAISSKKGMQKDRDEFAEKHDGAFHKDHNLIVLKRFCICKNWDVKKCDFVPLVFSIELWSDAEVRITLSELNKRRLQELKLKQLKFIADLYRQDEIVCSPKDAETFNSIKEQSIKERLELNYPKLKEEVAKHNQKKEEAKRARAANTTLNKAAWTFLGVCTGAAAVSGLWWWMTAKGSAAKTAAANG